MSKNDLIQQVKIRKELREVLERVINGIEDPLVGCRKIVALLHNLGDFVLDTEASNVIVAIESECDSFPVGDQRKLWQPETLALMDDDLNDYLLKTHDILIEACITLKTQL